MKTKFSALLLLVIACFATPLVGCGSEENKVMPKDESSIDTPEEMEKYEQESMGGSEDQDQN